MTQPLSPAAQAVLIAFRTASSDRDELRLAAALRALQLHVAPLDTNLRQTRIRCDIRDIATELENHQ